MTINKRAKSILTTITAGIVFTSFTFASAEMVDVKAPLAPIVSEEKLKEAIEYQLDESKVKTVEVAKITETPAYGYLEITVDSLNIRNTPDLTGTPVGAYKKGALVIAYTKTSNNWYKLSSGKYISGKYVKVRNDIKTYDQFVLAREAYIKAQQAAQQAAKPKPQQVVTGTGSTYRSISLTASERDLLAKLIKCEAGAESFNGQVAVAKVVFNRVKDKRFPNTVNGVIYAKKQFTPVSTGKINRVKATSTQYSAIDTALKSNDNLGGAIYFYAPSLVKSPWFESLKTVAVIGVHVFKVN